MLIRTKRSSVLLLCLVRINVHQSSLSWIKYLFNINLGHNISQNATKLWALPVICRSDDFFKRVLQTFKFIVNDWSSCPSIAAALIVVVVYLNYHTRTVVQIIVLLWTLFCSAICCCFICISLLGSMSKRVYIRLPSVAFCRALYHNWIAAWIIP